MERIDMWNTHYADYDSSIKVKDAVDELGQEVIELIDRSGGDERTIVEGVLGALDTLLDMYNIAAQYFQEHYTKGTGGDLTIFAWRETFDAVLSCICDIRRRVKQQPDSPNMTNLLLDLDEMAVDVRWGEYNRQRFIVCKNKEIFRRDVEKINELIADIEARDPEYTHELASL